MKTGALKKLGRPLSKYPIYAIFKGYASAKEYILRKKRKRRKERVRVSAVKADSL